MGEDFFLSRLLGLIQMTLILSFQSSQSKALLCAVPLSPGQCPFGKSPCEQSLCRHTPPGVRRECIPEKCDEYRTNESESNFSHYN